MLDSAQVLDPRSCQVFPARAISSDKRLPKLPTTPKNVRRSRAFLMRCVLFIASPTRVNCPTFCMEQDPQYRCQKCQRTCEKRYSSSRASETPFIIRIALKMLASAVVLARGRLSTSGEVGLRPTASGDSNSDMDFGKRLGMTLVFIEGKEEDPSVFAPHFTFKTLKAFADAVNN